MANPSKTLLAELELRCRESGRCRKVQGVGLGAVACREKKILRPRGLSKNAGIRNTGRGGEEMWNTMGKSAVTEASDHVKTEKKKVSNNLSAKLGRKRGYRRIGAIVRGKRARVANGKKKGGRPN